MTRSPVLLPADPPWFAGRRIELGLLHDLYAGLRGGGHPGPMVIAVDGVSGVGKSALVTRFAHTVAPEFPDGRLYLDLRGRRGEDGREALRALLIGLGAAAAEVPDTFDGLVGAYRSGTAGARLLVVLDDVRDPSQVRPLLPDSPDSLVLVTSRRPLTGLAASGGACLVELDRPDRMEARELLTAHLGREHDPAVLDEMAERCGRLPLALTIAAARLLARRQVGHEPARTVASGGFELDSPDGPGPYSSTTPFT
ncbi:hypothetical protein M1L60_24110 [Actinoplanes sp. TRM 88003]|uniref:Uncharacterized protein n=1 Tax=Paractinoplanes aksuensis TaxID=2939490 RepID=A0ABT1DUP5_9ACTN|nr:hypothetical protein [Actinoplanes aksuensis]MCO8273685.1 hypothetical protein [Actinoplanes aksuensis]